MPAVSFSETRKNLTQIADHVANEGVEYTVFKRSKPLFKIVPATQAAIPRTRRSIARQMAGGTHDYTDKNTQLQTVSHARGVSDAKDPIPDGGRELFEYAMRLRERSPLKGKLTDLTPEMLKQELADRDV